VTVLLDTHVWVWWLTADKRLPDGERRAIERAAVRGQTRVSAISMWEAQMLHAKGRLELPLPFDEWLRRAVDPRILAVAPVDVSVIVALDRLPATFHGDPADRLIVATAKANGWALATHDRVIRRARVAKPWRPMPASRPPTTVLR
jgi:PIN domain nuclease of toxin-antitoxin system